VISVNELYPPLGLAVRTPRLIIQPADEQCAAELANAVVKHGVHDPSHMPFDPPWTDLPKIEKAQKAFRNAMSRDPHQLTFAVRYQLTFAVRYQRTPNSPIGEVSIRGIDGKEWGHASVETGSWLLRPEHGKGVGTEVRQAMLALIFDGLGKDYALTASFDNNPASIAVTQKLGYTQLESEFVNNREERREVFKFELHRNNWTRVDGISWTGLDLVLTDLGLD
jgi:RimJ/RimL family protein N-acetyltransferase